MKQLYLLNQSQLKFYGGTLLKGRRKSKRPLSKKHPLHLVVRSEKAKGRASFFYFKKDIEYFIKKHGRRFGVKIYQVAIQSNHLHLVLRIHNRKLYGKFISAVTGAIAHRVCRGAGLEKQNRSFWQARPFTRILNWGRDYKQTLSYLTRNTLEALGFIPYKPRKNAYVRYLSG